MNNSDQADQVSQQVNTKTAREGSDHGNVSQKKRSNTTVWLILLSFAAPVALAYFIYFFIDVSSFTNRGEILNPIVNIGAFSLKDAQGKKIPLEKLTYKWRLISFLDKNCNKACTKRLYDSRQVHASLGKNRHRVDRMFIHFEPASDDLQKLIDEKHPGVIHVYGNDKIISNLLEGSVIDKDSHIRDNVIYIMDPMGNVMMRFTQDQPDKDFLYDLRKLLKASQIG